MEGKKTIKERIIYLYFQLLYHNIITPWVYIAICYYESILLIYFEISLVNSPGLKESLETIALMPYIIKQTSSTVFYVIMTVFSAVHLFSPFVLFVSLPTQDAINIKQTNYLTGLLLKVASFYVVLLIRPLSLWLFMLFFMQLFCSSGIAAVHSEVLCWNSDHLAYSILASFGLVAMLAELIFSAYLIPSDCYPESKQPWSGTMSYLGLPRIMVKLLTVLFSVINFKYGVLILLIYFYFAIQRAGCKQYIYNSQVFYHNIVSDVMVGIFCVGTSLSAYRSAELTILEGFIFVLVSVVFSVFCIVYKFHVVRTLIETPIAQLTKASDVTLCFVELMHSSRNVLKSVEDRMNVWSALCNHQKFCSDPSCECNVVESKLKEICKAYSHVVEDHDDTTEALHYKPLFIQKFLSVLLKDALFIHGDSVEVRLLASYIEEKQMNNYIKGYYNIMKAEENNPTFACELAILIHKQIIGSNIISKKQEKGIDVKAIWLFEKYYQMLMKDINTGAKKCVDFWNELLQVSINIMRLFKKSIKISELYVKITNLVHMMLDIYPDHTRLLRDYAKFLSDVVNNDIEAVEYIERASNAAKILSFVRADANYEDTRYGYNSTAVAIAISGNLDSIGTVQNVNDRITEFGYTKSEIIGNNISTLMPKYLASMHDSFILSYFNTGEASLLNKETILFIQHKSGFIKPVNLLVKCLPSLNEGLCFIGFIKKLPKESSFLQSIPKYRDKKMLLVLTDSKGHLLGFTRECFNSLGFVTALLYTGEHQREESCFSIKDLNADLLNPQYEEKLLHEGCEMIIKMSVILNKIEFEKLAQNEARVLSETVGSYSIYVQLVKHEYKNVAFRIYKIVILKRKNAQKVSSLMVACSFGDAEDSHIGKSKEKNRKSDFHKENSRQALILAESAQETSTIVGSTTSSTQFSNIVKEFKKQMSKEATHHSITYLNRGVLIILLLLVGVTLFDLAMKLQYANNFVAELKAICLSNNRRFLTVELCGGIRSIVNIAAQIEKGNFQGEPRVPRLIKEMKTDMENLQKIQQQLDNNVFDITASLFKLVKQRSLKMREMDSDCNIRVVNVTMSVAISQLIMYSIQIVNEDLTSLPNDPLPLLHYGQNSCSSATLIGRSIYFVIENSIGTLESASIAATEGYLNSALNNTDRDENYLLIVMCCYISFIVLSVAIIIPVLVRAESNKVIALSIYSQLQVDNAKKMLEKCKKYITDQEGINEALKSIQEEEIKKEDETKENTESQKTDCLNTKKSLKRTHSIRMTNENSGLGNSNSIGSSSSKANANNEQKLEKKEDEAALIEKPQIANKIGHEETFKKFETNILKILLGLFIIAGGIFCYVVICYFLAVQLFDETRTAFRQIVDITDRSPTLSYCLILLRGMIIRGNNIMNGDVDLLEYYIDKAKNTEKAIKFAKAKPSNAILEFVDLLKRIDSTELCAIATNTDKDRKYCTEFNGRVMSNGVKDAIYWYINRVITLRQIFQPRNGSFSAEKAREMINSDTELASFYMKDKFINPTMWTMQDNLFAAIENHYGEVKTSNIIQSVSFIVCILFIILLIWNAFLSALNKEVFRARGILNLLPTDFILNDDSVRKEVMRIISF